MGKVVSIKLIQVPSLRFLKESQSKHTLSPIVPVDDVLKAAILASEDECISYTDSQLVEALRYDVECTQIDLKNVLTLRKK